MNAAQEIILNWYLERCDLSRGEIDLFMGALGRGYSKREKDAVYLMAQYTQQALAYSKGTEFEELVGLLYRLSEQYEIVERNEKVVEGFLKLKEIAATEKSGLMNERITRAKVQSVIDEIERISLISE